MNTLLGCVFFWSAMNGLDHRVTQAIISVESNGNPLALGRLRDSGLMQIRPQFVPYSQKQLLQSCTNIMVGTALLKKAKEKCKHKIDKTWVTCYNLGVRGGSRLKYPKKWAYYVKVTKKLEE